MGTPADKDPPASTEFDNGNAPSKLRWPDSFNPPSGMFAPGEPLWPVIQEPLRTFDFRVGINTILTPRTGELRSFEQLRSFANVELVRLAIETRKDQINKLDWQIKPREDKPKVRRDSAERIRAVTKFMKKPDGVRHFHDWLRLLLEDLFSIDAPCLERRRNRGGSITGYDVIPGDTIKLLVDYNGRTPLPPTPAYQQIIKGRVWNLLTTNDLIYAPRNLRPGHVYGFSPVEQIIVTIHTSMLRQTSQLAYFSDGNVPAGLVGVPDEWTPNQIKEWQDWMDEKFAGNLAERRKLLWAPSGGKYQAFKEAPIKDEFDEWLARVVAYCFSLPATPFIKQTNRMASQADQERAIDEGQQPLKQWVKRFLDDIVQEDLGYTDLEFDWIKEEDIDPQIESEINNSYLKTGVVRINEVRDSIGMDPIPGGDTTLIYTAKGAITLDDVLTAPTQKETADTEKELALNAANSSGPSGSSNGNSSNAASSPKAGKKISNEDSEKIAKAVKSECDDILGLISSLTKTKGSKHVSTSLSGL